MRHSTQNAILTKLSTWEYGNGGNPFSRRKSGRVLRLVSYSAPAGFRVYVYGAYQHAQLWRAKAFQSIKHVDACRIHGETNITWWDGLRLSYCDDHAHNIAWMCTHNNQLECIPTLQGQEQSWFARVIRITMRVHHTNCTITHTRASACAHTRTHTQSRKVK